MQGWEAEFLRREEKRSMVLITVTAWNKDGYSKVIATMSDRQLHSSESRIKVGTEGVEIDPADFPEMVRFTIKVEDGKGCRIV